MFVQILMRYDPNVASTDGAARASEFGVQSEFAALQSARQRRGLVDYTDAQVLPIRLVAALQVHSSPTQDGTRGVVNNADLAARLSEVVFDLGLSRDDRAIAYLTWNLKPSDRETDSSLIDCPAFGSSMNWTVRIDNVLEHDAKAYKDQSLRVLPDSWTDAGTVRGKSDDLIIKILMALIRSPRGQSDTMEVGAEPPDRAVAHSGRIIVNERAIEVASVEDPRAETSKLIELSVEGTQSFLAIQDGAPSDETLESLLALTKYLASSYSLAPPEEILREALRIRVEATPIIDRVRDPRKLSELYFIYGRLLGILAYATLDLGNADGAYQHTLAAIKSARLSGHADLQAWALGTQSMILRFKQEYSKSLSVVEKGLILGVQGSSLARLHAQAALGYSELVKADETVEALRKSNETVDDPPSGTDLEDGIFFFPRAKYHYYAGSGLLALSGEHAIESANESAQAIDRFKNGLPSEVSYSDELLARVFMAAAELESENLDAIPESLTPLFQAEPRYRTSWHHQWLRRLIRKLEQNPRYKGASVTRELRLAIEDFGRRSAE